MTNDHLKIGAIVQARMSSSRVPGKVLAEVGDKPLLYYLVESLGQCRQLDGLVLATSVEPSDDPVAEFCERECIPCYRGPLGNVAKRFSLALQETGWDGFLRISGDSPFLDWRVADRALTLFRGCECDLVTNVLKRTFPVGQSVEVVRTASFLEVESGDLSVYQREHVTPYFYENPDIFRIEPFENDPPYVNSTLAVDTPKDMDRFKKVVEMLERPHWEYTFAELLDILKTVEVET